MPTAARHHQLDASSITPTPAIVVVNNPRFAEIVSSRVRYAGLVSRDRVDPAAQLLLAFEMFEVGVAMMREKLRRKSPQASAEEVERQLDRWLLQVDEPLPTLGNDEDHHQAAVEAP